MTVQEAPVVIEMWSDLTCPWCYVGEHRLQAAIDQRPDANRFEVRPRSFELNPDATREPETIESAFIRSHGGSIRCPHGLCGSCGLTIATMSSQWPTAAQ